MNRKRLSDTLIILIAIFVAYFHREILKIPGLNLKAPWEYPYYSMVVQHLAWLVVIGVTALILYRSRFKDALEHLGLTHSPFQGFSIAFLFTLPMLVGYGLAARAYDFSFSTMWFSALMPAFMEELLFRGFAFGLLFRRAQWGFLPAVAIPSFLFAGGHWYQGSSLMSALAIFAVTLIGSLWFAWLWVEWNFNLWIPIGLHFFMNLWWSVFGAGHTALGGLYANGFRIATIILSVVVTIRRRKRLGSYMISRKRLLFGA